ncbi:hypothetical protein BGX27_010835 [Mortierella sp. AM989]|nr:hypothetical protein BGX27_010835 [Mortierella sp. AM989]
MLIAKAVTSSIISSRSRYSDELDKDQPQVEITDETQLQLFVSVLKSLEIANRPMDSAKSKISSLVLPSYASGYPISVLIPLIRDHLPNIVSFSVPKIKNDSQLNLQQEFSQLFFKLRHITVCFDDDPEEQDVAKALIISCSEGAGLISFREVHYTNEITSVKTLSVLDTLVKYHHATLEKVELLNCLAIGPQEIQSVLATCRKLWRFLVTLCTGYTRAIVSTQLGNAMSDLWVCLDLKELVLDLSVGDADDSNGSETEPSTSTKNNIYLQIGRLVKLELLYLVSDTEGLSEEELQVIGKYLTLKHGWLVELKGLKELRHLVLGSVFWKQMGQAEVEFIHSNWPRLMEISLLRCLDQENPDQKPHWQWLRGQRLNLTIAVDL